MKKLTLLILNIIMFAIGNCGGPLISRLYFIRGGQRIWLSSWLQTVACPLILIPLSMAYFQRRKIDGPEAAKIFFITRREFIGAAGIGIIAGLDGYLISWGPAKLPVSTSSLINATQLAFTALFAVLLVKQKLTAYSKFSVVLLITGAAMLALRGDGDRPAGESVKEYMLGFVMTVMGAVCFGLMMPLIEFIYVKAKQVVTYTTVLEIQMIIGIFATAFCTVGMIINKDFQAIPREASQYEIGEAKYYLVLVSCAILWQLALLGLVGVIFYSSSLLSGIIGAFLLPVTEVLAVILFHEKFQVEKGVAIFLALGGFISYFYGEIEQSKKEKRGNFMDDHASFTVLHQSD
ncbi:purine permease 1-like [Lycium ferocissimum]|uniref:purine permease 1-like n=1 Tax=Lycium ferocissimum TaxID=112874 RepID=UPI002815D905|nr:purine permease 1-like [Lycium ferocissimum]